MRTGHPPIRTLLASLALLALLSVFAESASAHKMPDTVPADSSSKRPLVDDPVPFIDSLLPGNAFSRFLRDIRRSDDSLHFHLGEQAFSRKEYDSALAFHLAVQVPVSGAFREALLAQRSRIQSRIWNSSSASVASASSTPGPAIADPERPRPTLEWSLGSSHAREVFRTGPLFPYGRTGFGSESRYWNHAASLRQSWPVSLRDQVLDLALSADASLARADGASTYRVAMETGLPDMPMLANMFLSMSAGQSSSPAWGTYRSYDLRVEKAWYFSDVHGLRIGGLRQWDGKWRRLRDQVWATASRDLVLRNGNRLGASLSGSYDGSDPYADQFQAPVWSTDGLSESADPVGEVALTLRAPQSFFSLSPAATMDFHLPAGWQAQTGAIYAVDLYPEYVWDWVPWPDSLDPASGDWAGLAWNPSDGRHYSAVLVEEGEGFKAYYGSVPREHRRARRVDQQASLHGSLWRNLPRGYALTLEGSVGWTWSNLPATSPAESQPWHWQATVVLSRASVW